MIVNFVNGCSVERTLSIELESNDVIIVTNDEMTQSVLIVIDVREHDDGDDYVDTINHTTSLDLTANQIDLLHRVNLIERL